MRQRLIFQFAARSVHSIKPTMEVEVKLRLPNSQSHQNLSRLLSSFLTETQIQENVFFDGSKMELASKLAVLRLRFYNVDAKCVLSLKSKPVISDGISRVEEQEEPIEPAIGRACIPEAWRLMSIGSSKIMKRVREEYGVGEDGLVCLGGFRNVRQVYKWKGFKLEVDETNFDFGTSYEIECESSEPERVKKILEEFLQENGISYSYSTVSKFAVFRGCLILRAANICGFAFEPMVRTLVMNRYPPSYNVLRALIIPVFFIKDDELAG